MAWLNREQIERIGFIAVGDEVRISDRASFHGADRIRIGSHVRIDDFTIVTAHEPVTIGSYCHLSARVFIGGTHGVEMADFTNLSVGSCVFTSCDDLSGNHLIGAAVPDLYRGLTNGKVVLDKYSGAGANSVVLPGVHMPIGSGIGALTLAHKSLEPWTLYLGVPMRKVKRTSTKMIELEARLLTKGHGARCELAGR